MQALDAEDEEEGSTRTSLDQSYPARSQSPKGKTPEFEILKLRLSPIRALEEELIKQLASTDDNEAVRLAAMPGHSRNTAGSKGGKDNKEVSVRTTNNWKKAFARSSKGRDDGEVGGWWEDPNDPVHLLNACAEDMRALWTHPTVKETLKRRRIRLEESSGL